MARITLTRGYFAEVDEEDLQRLSQYSWQANVGAQIRALRCEGRARYYMHHEVLKVSSFDLRRLGKEVDHIDGNTLNNRKTNLRLVTHTENMRNTKRHLERKGYCYNKRAGLWSVYCDEPDKKRVYLGYTKTEEEAAERIKEYRNGTYRKYG